MEPKMLQPRLDIDTPQPPAVPLGQSLTNVQQHLEQVYGAVSACTQQLERATQEMAAAEIDMLHRIRDSMQREFAADRAAATVRSQHLEILAEQIAEDRRSLESQEQQIAAAQLELTRTSQQLDERALELDGRQHDLSQRFAELDHQLRSLDQRRRELEAGGRELEASRQAFAQQSRRTISQLRRQQQRQQAQLDSRRREIDHKQQQSALDLARQQQEQERLLAQQQSELDLTRREIIRLHDQLDHRRQEMELAQTRVNCQAQHIRDRTQRLERVHKAITSQIEALRQERASVDTSRRCAKQILDQRDGILDMQRLLLEAEHRMIYRWGLERSLGWIGRALAVVLVLMVGSYLVAGQFKTQVFAATAVLGQKSSSTDSAAWIAQQRQRLLSDSVLQQIIVHLNQNPTLPASPADLRDLLERSLNIQSPGAGTLVLELRGSDRDTLTPILQAAVRGLTTSHSLLAGKVPEEQEAIVVLQAAKLLTQPVASNHLTLAATGVGLALPIVAALAFGLAHLLRTRQQLETALLSVNPDEQAHWQMLAQQYRSSIPAGSAAAGLPLATVDQPADQPSARSA
jgi:hypothetical protein